MKGFFITLEGIDGSGKSTLAKGLAKRLQDGGYEVLSTRAPGGTDVGRAIRELILHSSLQDIKTELFLFLADRAEHVSSVIKPALQEGKVVICDRFTESTIAYQSQRGLDLTQVIELSGYAASGLEPDMTLLIDIPPELAFARIEKARHKDRIENEGLYLLTKIASCYRERAKHAPRTHILDGQLSLSELLDTCFDYVIGRIDAHTS